MHRYCLLMKYLITTALFFKKKKQLMQKKNGFNITYWYNSAYPMYGLNITFKKHWYHTLVTEW